jgi:hypothetical protein
MEDLAAVRAKKRAHAPERTDIEAGALAARVDRDALGAQLAREQPFLVKTNDAAIVAGGLLCEREVDDDALEPSAIQILDDMRNPHAKISSIRAARA